MEFKLKNLEKIMNVIKVNIKGIGLFERLEDYAEEVDPESFYASIKYDIKKILLLE